MGINILKGGSSPPRGSICAPLCCRGMEAESGAFFATVARPKSWFHFAKTSTQVQVQQKTDLLFKRYSARLEQELSQSPDGTFARLSRAASLSPRQAEESKVQKYVFGSDGQCSMTVLPGASSIASNLYRVLPYVHSDSTYLLCFFGYLSNLSELAHIYNCSVTKDASAATTSLILTLYQKCVDHKTSGSEKLFLSELQGQYSFFLYDGHSKQALAARDPSGEQQLFWSTSANDNSVAFTNTLDQLPPGELLSSWHEVPPGHYVSGRTPILHQFALTPEQLEIRERNESANLGLTDEESSEGSAKDHSPKSLPHAASNLLARLSKKL